jgi:hypothetical protein
VRGSTHGAGFSNKPAADEFHKHAEKHGKVSRSEAANHHFVDVRMDKKYASGGSVASGSKDMNYDEGGQIPQSPRYAKGGIHQSNHGLSNDTNDMARQLADDSYAHGGMPHGRPDTNPDASKLMPPSDELYHKGGRAMFAQGSDGDVIDSISKAADAALDWLGGDARATSKQAEAERQQRQTGNFKPMYPQQFGNKGNSQGSSSSGYASGGSVKSGSGDMNLADGSQYPVMEGKTQPGQDPNRKMYADDQDQPVSQDDNAPKEQIADSSNLSPDQLERAHQALDKISRLKDHLTDVVHGAGKAWAGAMGPAIGPDGKTLPSNAQNAVAAENNPDQAQPDVSQDPNTTQQPQNMSQGPTSDVNQPTNQPADQSSPQPDASQGTQMTGQATPTPVKPTVQQMAEQSLQRVQQDPKTPPDVRSAPPAKQVQYDQHKQQTLQDMTKDTVDWQQAIANSQITPKTYSDLFNYNEGNVKPGSERSTLSKIGMLFASLVGGAGAGLSHQPNAMLGMMDNVIKNDLDAQTKSKQNAYNYYNLAIQHEKNKAEQGQLNIDTKQKAYNLSLMQMRQSALADLVRQGNAIQDPKQKQAYMEGLAMMANEIGGANYNLADQFAIGQARQKMILGDMNQAGPGQPQGQIDPAKEIKRRELTGVMTPGDASAAREEVKMIQNHNTVNDNTLDSFDKTANLTRLASRAKSPVQSASRINAEWDTMVEKLTRDTAGRVTPISADMVGGLKPLITDNPDTLAIKRDKLNRIIHAGYSTPTLDSNNISISKQQPGPIQQEQQGQQSEANTIERLDPKSGKIVIYDAKTKKPLRYK